VTRDFGRHLFGLAAVVYGALTLYWHGVNSWPQLQSLANAPYHEFAGNVAAGAAIVGGIAIQFLPTAQLGAGVLGALYLIFAALYVPRIVAGPLVYDHWGNFFEQFSIFAGALIAYASLAPGRPPWAVRLAGIGRVCFGISTLSFALEQGFYVQATAGFVPKWIPPGQTFWAIATTVAFVLAAAAIVSGRQALLATRLVTAMLLVFGMVVWLPALFADPKSHGNWSETTETFAITGAAWILAASLRAKPWAASRLAR
jgi:hypothetical protein